MEINKLIFSNQYRFELASNTFVGVPVILKYEDINLIEIIKETTVEYTTKIPIFHSDGTHLADAKGNRIYKTDAGKKAGIDMIINPGLWACTLEGKTIFEIRQRNPDSFRTTAELYTNDGYFVKVLNAPKPILIDINGNSLKIGGATMIGNIIAYCPVGIWIRKNGSLSMG